MDILEKIVEYKIQEIAQLKAKEPLNQLIHRLADMETSHCASMRESLMRGDYGIIAEMKRRSPSKGWIKADADPAVIPLDYQKNGAAALSILTDEHFFSGKNEFISEARLAGVNLPILYKNFVVDRYQLYEARLCGASAVLLIAACLSESECKELVGEAHSLGLEVLLEMHGEEELRYADANPDMFGVNNRNLGTFETDVENSFILAGALPKGACLVSESGISRPETVVRLIRAGYRGFLIGETFMKEAIPGAALREFICGMQSILTKKN